MLARDSSWQSDSNKEVMGLNWPHPTESTNKHHLELLEEKEERALLKQLAMGNCCRDEDDRFNLEGC